MIGCSENSLKTLPEMFASDSEMRPTVDNALQTHLLTLHYSLNHREVEDPPLTHLVESLW